MLPSPVTPVDRLLRNLACRSSKIGTVQGSEYKLTNSFSCLFLTNAKAASELVQATGYSACQ